MDQNTRELVRRTCDHRTEHKGQTPSPRIENKIRDPVGNRIQAGGLEGRDSTGHATATDFVDFRKKLVIKYYPPLTIDFSNLIIIIIIIREFCPRADLSLQTQAPRLQFFPKADLPQQSQEPRLQFY